MAVLALTSQDGRSLSYELKPGQVKYRLHGQVLTTYVGGVKAPGKRQGDIDGVFTLVTQPRGEKWVIVGKPDELRAQTGGKPADADEAKRALRGIWTQVVGGDSLYTVNGKAVVPSQLSGPLWPIAWAPILPASALKIGDEIFCEFQFPLQAFLEDDPIGRVPIHMKATYNGPEYPSSAGILLFTLRADETLDMPVKHPEDSGLNLKGHVIVDARLKIDRADGRLVSSSTVMSVELALEGKKYPFGFSRAKGSVTSNLERLK